jgi:hypothetical protein
MIDVHGNDRKTGSVSGIDGSLPQVVAIVQLRVLHVAIRKLTISYRPLRLSSIWINPSGNAI